MNTGIKTMEAARMGASARDSAMSLDQSAKSQPIAKLATSKISADLVKPKDTANLNASGHGEEIAPMFALAAQGRRQAAAVASRLARLDEAVLSATAESAFLWAIGADLGVKPDGREVLRRLGQVLDTSALKLAEALMRPETVKGLRIFRLQVRELVSPAPVAVVGRA